ncbi:MAG TPA: transglycosylase family protein [Candidatus Saccharimonadales bacterium]|nr:transglycosylase family protein [Candidatus Saccharimonadales bacterium]
MRNYLHTLVAHLSLTAQVISPFTGLITASATAQASVETPAPYEIKLDTLQVQPVTVVVAPKPNFDTDVIAPLKAKQEATKAAKLAARRAAVKVATTKVVAPAGDDAFYQIRLCESGSTYTRNSGNGYFGAYQYSLGTWNNYGGYARPDLAPAEVQDTKAHADQAVRGWRPWPACARKLGLL